MSLYSALTQVLAPFAAKIKGIQTGYDGTEYDSPGEAVREQINDLHILIGDEPGTAIQASAIAYNDSNVAAELTNVNGRLQEFTGEVRTDYYEPHETDKTFDYTYDMSNVGILNANGSVTPNSSYHYGGKIAVEEGDEVTITAVDSNYGVTVSSVQANRVCFYNGDTVVASAGSDSPTKPITVPSGVDGIVITLTSNYVDGVMHVTKHGYIEYIPKIIDMEKAVDETLPLLVDSVEKKCVIKVSPEIVPGKFINKSGSVVANSAYYYFELDVRPGDVIQNIRTFYSNSTSIVIGTMRFVCAYKEGGTAVVAKGAESVKAYTVPDGIVKIAVTIDSNYPLSDYICIFRDAETVNIKDNDNVDSTLFASFPQTITGDMAASSRLALTSNSVKKNKEILFYGKITSFDKITVGQGGTDINSERVEVDGTNITVYAGTAAGVSVPHGLTFIDYVAVAVKVDNDRIGHITVSTGSGKFVYDTTSVYVGCMRSVYAETGENTILTDCALSFVCNDIKEPVWVFGDSYVSYTSDRWPYHISKMGFNGYLLNGYSGEPSAYAITDLNNLLQYGTPRYIVWCMGMNDADTDTTYNRLWKGAIDELLAICNEKHIVPILCTIPNVPDRSHVYKNAEVMASGHRYINFASAVGALEDSTWYSGMLSNDNVHPTVTGGIALAAQLLKDFSLICIR